MIWLCNYKIRHDTVQVDTDLPLDTGVIKDSLFCESETRVFRFHQGIHAGKTQNEAESNNVAHY